MRFRGYFYRISFLIWFGLITALSLFSVAALPKHEIRIDYFDKLVHFAFYFLLSGLAIMAYAEGKKVHPTLTVALTIMLLASFYGVGVEVLQEKMDYGREGDIYDAIANTIGAVVGGSLVQKYHSLIRWLK